MKQLFIMAIAIATMSFTAAKWSVICSGKKNDGSTVKLINHDGKNYIIYYDRNDCQMGNSIETSMQPRQFAVWCQPMGYMSDCYN